MKSTTIRSAALRLSGVLAFATLSSAGASCVVAQPRPDDLPLTFAQMDSLNDWQRAQALLRQADGVIGGERPSVPADESRAAPLGDVSLQAGGPLDGTWEQLSPMELPRPRYGHVAVVDETRRRMLIFGTYAANTTDTWSLDMSGPTYRWTKVP